MKKIFIWFILRYLRFFARLALSISKPKTIGITGSVGKSSTRNAVYAMMKDYFKVKVIKEGNSESGIPLGILGISPGHYRLFDWLRIMIQAPFRLNNIKNIDYLIVEMGIDSPFPPKNMDYLLTIIKPDISVVLNVYPVHTMQFDELFSKDIQDEKRLDYILKRITKEKLKIITIAKPRVGIINRSINLQLSVGSETELISFGKDDNADIKFTDYQVSLKKTSFKYYLKKENNNIIIDINNYALPYGYLEVFAATVAIGKSIGISNDKIVKGIKNNFTVPSGRGEIFEGIKSSTIIDSSYNASRASMITFLEMAKKISLTEKRPLVVLLGDMRELGEEAEIEHKKVAEKIAELNIDQVYCVGPNTKKFLNYKKWFKTSIEAGDYLKTSLPQKAVVLVKGSQNEIFLEEAVKKILKNKSDIKRLCRQDDFWLKKKSEFFQGV